MTDKQVLEILKSMDLPPGRLIDFTIRDLCWLENNIGIRNSNHPQIKEVISWVQSKLKAK